MKTKHLTVAISGFKALDDSNGKMAFTCYGNVKGNIDHARDRTLDGAYQKSINEHRKNGTMPKMFWMHNAMSMPVGKWVSMEEDSKGLLLKGELYDDEEGRKIYARMKDGVVDSFSIGYRVIKEKWNIEKNCNDLVELDIKEVSIVTFACNEESRLVDIKSKMDDGELPSKRELQDLLRDSGLSKRQAERIVNQYEPEVKCDAVADLAKYLTENNVSIKL